MDAQMDGLTDTQTPYKTYHLYTLYGCGQKNSTLFLLPLTIICSDNTKLGRFLNMAKLKKN